MLRICLILLFIYISITAIIGSDSGFAFRKGLFFIKDWYVVWGFILLFCSLCAEKGYFEARLVLILIGLILIFLGLNILTSQQMLSHSNFGAEARLLVSGIIIYLGGCCIRLRLLFG
jgi:hypothetical protein